jgi:hypothetical protein
MGAHGRPILAAANLDQVAQLVNHSQAEANRAM